MRRRKYLVCACVVVFIYRFLGVEDYLFSRSFDGDFNYPLDIELQPVVQDILSGNRPTVTPINHYSFKYLSTSKKCANYDKIDLLILVKSAIEHLQRRKAIRLTYGRDDVAPGKIVKTLFFLGTHRNSDPNMRKRVALEKERFGDIIQSDFEDNYYNMTIKTMMSFRWAYEHCSLAGYYLFTDDDMYISVKNLLKYLDVPTGTDEQDNSVRSVVLRNKAYDSHLLAGYVFKSSPQRFWTSKWRVSLEEYPWNRWPPYVTAGAYVISNKSMRVVHVASAFVKHFRFDDIYLGIIAKKVGIELTHCDQFHFYKKKYTKDGYKDVIASHGYGDPQELIKVWTEQNGLQHRGYVKSANTHLGSVVDYGISLIVRGDPNPAVGQYEL